MTFREVMVTTPFFALTGVFFLIKLKLTGCDTTSKIGTKTAIISKYLEVTESFFAFGKNSLPKEILSEAEKVLLRILGVSKCTSFDEFRVKQFYNSDRRLDCMVSSSSTISLHIKRAFLQASTWMNASSQNPHILDPMNFGYFATENGHVFPKFVVESVRPTEIPEPCRCTSCTRRTCNCRENSIPCVWYCKCDPEKCKNKFNDEN